MSRPPRDAFKFRVLPNNLIQKTYNLVGTRLGGSHAFLLLIQPYPRPLRAISILNLPSSNCHNANASDSYRFCANPPRFHHAFHPVSPRFLPAFAPVFCRLFQNSISQLATSIGFINSARTFFHPASTRAHTPRRRYAHTLPQSAQHLHAKRSHRKRNEANPKPLQRSQ